MKKIKYFIVLLALCFSCNIAHVKAADLLISLNNGISKFAITSETSVAEIEAKLGKAKLVTPSAFGGSAMTFYTNDNYDNYLYIETTSDGKIATFGSFDETFKTSK